MTPLKGIMNWARQIFKGFWSWHVENIGLLSDSLIQSGKVGIAAMGRELCVKTKAKHAIKRVDKFLSNKKVPFYEMLAVYIQSVIGPRQQIGICCDWTKIRDWPVLVASLVYQGRSIPLLWAVMDGTCLNKSVNAFEYGFFTLLSRLLPKNTSAVILLDRGFKRVALLEHLEQCGFYYVIRSGGSTWMEHPTYTGYMQNIIRKQNMGMDFKDALIQKKKRFCTRVVAVWENQQKEPWILTTNCNTLTARQVIHWYGRRFQIEEMFRDQKSHRFGWALGELKMFQAGRLERLLFVVAFAQWLVMMLGAKARSLSLEKSFRANTGKNATQHSDFYLGRYYIKRIPWRPKILIPWFLQHLSLMEINIC